MKKKIMGFVLATMLLVPMSLLARGGSSSSSKKSDKMTIAGIIFQSDQFFQVVQRGMEEAAAANDADILMGSSDNKLDKEAQLIDTYITRGVDAIMISPLSDTASHAALKRAYDKGIKIITYNTTLKDNAIISSHIAMSDTMAGEHAGEMALAVEPEFDRPYGSDLNVAVICFDAQLPEQSGARVDGFINKVGEQYNVNVVARQSAWLAEMSIRVTGDVLTANKDNIDVIIAVNDGGTVGAVQAVKNANLQDQIGVYGLSGPNEQLANMLVAEDSAVHGITFYEPYQVGELSLKNAIKAVTDDNPAETEMVGYRPIKYGETDQASEYLEVVKSYTE